MGMPGRTGDHDWSQRHLSHYIEGELRPRARRRLDRHARGCADCGRGIRAMRALVTRPRASAGCGRPRARNDLRPGPAGRGRRRALVPERVTPPGGAATPESPRSPARRRPAGGVTRSAAAGGPAAETEASLLARAQAGDVTAFERLSGAYADRLFMLLFRLLGDRAEAEDVAQEVMLRAWRGIARFRGQSSYFTWLYRIAVNEANRALEKRARQPAGVPIAARELDLPAAPERGPVPAGREQ